MLYSVVIFDLCSKLSELENSYNDGAAKQILEEAKARNASDQPWEKLLIESTYSRGIIEKKLFSDIDHLYSDRCFSAHPSLEGNFELQTPSKETTIAHIKNMLNGLFTSPPTFNKNLINIITNDIEQRKEVLNDFDKLRSYLDRSYYSRMTQPARIAFFF